MHREGRERKIDRYRQRRQRSRDRDRKREEESRQVEIKILRTESEEMEGSSRGEGESFISWGDKHLRVNTLSSEIDRQVFLQIRPKDG